MLCCTNYSTKKTDVCVCKTSGERDVWGSRKCYVGGAKPPGGSLGVRYGWRGMQQNLMEHIAGGADTNDESSWWMGVII
jgi:hypothetical protein